MKFRQWELPAAVDTASLLASFTRSLLEAVKQTNRCKRLFDNAYEAVAIASKAGALSQELLDEKARRDLELHIALTAQAHAEGMVLEAEQLHAARQSLPFVEGEQP